MYIQYIHTHTYVKHLDCVCQASGTVRRPLLSADTTFSIFWFSEAIAAEYFGPLFRLLSVLNTVTCLDPEPCVGFSTCYHRGAFSSYTFFPVFPEYACMATR